MVTRTERGHPYVVGDLRDLRAVRTTNARPASGRRTISGLSLLLYGDLATVAQRTSWTGYTCRSLALLYWLAPKRYYLKTLLLALHPPTNPI